MGYTLVPVEADVSIDMEFFTNGDYEELPDGWCDFNGPAQEYTALARYIQHEEGTPIAKDITRSMFTLGGSIRSCLLKTCKAHKSPVVFRNVHAAGKFVFAGLSHWASRRLRATLNELGHVVKDRRDAARRLMHRPMSQSEGFLTFDVKDFFMSGDAESLVEDVLVSFTGREKATIGTCALPASVQSICCFSKFPGRVWKVVKGTGMGLQHSGDLSDLALANRMERWAINNCFAHGITSTSGFEMTFCASTKNLAKAYAFYQAIKERAGYFKLLVSGGGRGSIGWLELTLFRRSGSIACKPKFKDIFNYTPLFL
ncbi:unnamed protein product [Prorocentrum cordatum]|uniref:Reverse transcriptase Ty1/copia-type domain-containing protein n=1 Tax=Prorocentrum cordatum TaxID=2364126 RepID=A0ABN9VNB5_9DINO|nr:unnamed protein product [Polarella glacialis]